MPCDLSTALLELGKVLPFCWLQHEQSSKRTEGLELCNGHGALDAGLGAKSPSPVLPAPQAAAGTAGFCNEQRWTGKLRA